ncbi:MAG TPA: class I SAM-dependent methyltransferase [Tepidisphaeraceae bacterium]|jgi:hypothetical protein
MSTSILDAYVRTAPSPQNAIDIFKGEWSSKLPPPYNNLSAGGIPLFQDGRIAWALGQLGGVEGQNVLELGPLEGGHSYMLERNGAASILSIEANSRAYLKCLITKELLNLQRARFVCGDFIAYLENTNQRFDFILAAGVLYHMKDPARLLQLIAQHTDRAYIWTHHYLDSVISNSALLRRKFTTATPHDVDGVTITHHRQEYGDTLDAKTFCGGSNEYSYWLEKDDILAVLKKFGFAKFELAHDQLDHPHGPAISIVAKK